ncbi:hypothetical protein LCGC14_1437410 [marine sediment metagenome]|uniref:DUF3850 domain-containing protein n=1 Tax=marine sediment metagenome TaxID=412755 RepID=A0A0F9JLW6_9ZZZZ
MEHELKSWPEYFNKILDGTKPFEYRINDRGFNDGDILILKEWIPLDNEYTGRRIRLLIKNIWEVIPGLPTNYCIITFRFLDYYETS